MHDTVKQVESFTISISRDVRYLGELSSEEQLKSRGYFVRQGNRTVYPTVDRSLFVCVETDGGRVGWGETYGIVAPGSARVTQSLLAFTGLDINRRNSMRHSKQPCWSIG